MTTKNILTEITLLDKAINIITESLESVGVKAPYLNENNVRVILIKGCKYDTINNVMKIYTVDDIVIETSKFFALIDDTVIVADNESKTYKLYLNVSEKEILHN